MLWLKSEKAGEAVSNSGQSVIVGFSGEDEMLLWLDVLASIKVGDEDDPAAYVPVLGEVMTVRSRGGRRLPRVPTSARNTLSLVDSLEPADAAASPTSLASPPAAKETEDLKSILGDGMASGPTNDALLSLNGPFFDPAARRGGSRVAPLGRRK